MIVAAALIAAVTYRFFELSYVTGNSMEPTYKNGDILLVCKWRSPKSGDIVTAYINDLERVVVKRVVGKPGDWIRYTTKGIYRNGEPVQTDRNPKKQETELCEVFIPEGYIFLLGDNWKHSFDSRNFGCIPIDAVRGVVIKR